MSRSKGSRSANRLWCLISLSILIAIFLVAFNRHYKHGGGVQSVLANLNQATGLDRLEKQAASAVSGAASALAAQAPSDASVWPDGSDSKMHTLVLYNYDSSDPEYVKNFKYFAQFGMAEGDGCYYMVIVHDKKLKESDLPALPSNAVYRFYKGRCTTTWGKLGWVLMSVNRAQYRYFIFMEGSLRGPFLPTFLRGVVHWTTLITAKLDDRTKLVGPTISCEAVGLPDKTNEGPVEKNPFVEPGLMATDQMGLKLMEKDGKIFSCDNAGWELTYYSKMGSSRAVLREGYNIDSFMIRYANVDWTDRRTWECNARERPVGEYFYDGVTVHPLELMFVPVDSTFINNDWSFAKLAAKYQSWMEGQEKGTLDIASNVWVSKPWPMKHQRVAYMRSRGLACFDHRYYSERNPDLKVFTSPVELWEHYVNNGQFEGRPIRWSCEDTRKLPWED